jgi:hypothetical protein
MDRLSEYVDGTLPAAERAQVEAWLRTSAEGREAVVELERVKRRAGSLAARPVPESVWLGVRSAIRSERRRGAGSERKRIALSLAQLSAAAAVLLAVGGAGAWWMLRSNGGTQPNVASANPTDVRSDSGRQAATAPAPASAAEDRNLRLVTNSAKVDRTYDRAINDLERVVTANRRQLRPETVKVIRENLARIDSALTRAQQALEQDPHNPYLYDHLTEMRQRKLDLLRRTANLASAS